MLSILPPALGSLLNRFPVTTAEPPPVITSIRINGTPNPGSTVVLVIRGTNFQSGLSVDLDPDPAGVATIDSVAFRSPQRVNVRLTIAGDASAGTEFNLVLTNPDGQSFVVPDAISIQ